MRRCTSWMLVLAVLGAWAPLPAQASPLFELLGDNTGLGGFNARVVGKGSAAAYFNPGLLPHAEQGLQVGLSLVHDNIGIRLKRRPGLYTEGCGAPGGVCSYDIPDGGESYLNGDGSALDAVFLPTPWLNEGLNDQGSGEALAPRPRGEAYEPGTVTYYITAGLVVRLLEQYAVFGVHMTVPTDEFTRAQAFYVDEREQAFTNSLQPELYSDRLKAPSIAFGLGSQLHRRFSLGVSATLKLINGAGAPTYVPDPNELGDVELSSDVSVDIGLSPHGGIWAEPLDGWTVTATVHSPQRLDVTANYSFQLRNGLSDSSTLQFTHGYLPWKATLGTAYEFSLGAGQRLSAVGSAEFTRWSTYVNRQSDEPAGDYAWDDTWSGTLGLRYGYVDLEVALDATFVPTPVPDQTGRTNYVDNDRLGAAIAAEYRIPLIGDSVLFVGGQLQAHRLLPRSVTKMEPTADTPADQRSQLVRDTIPDDAVDGARGDRAALGREGLQTNNPGFPGFGSEGWLTAATLYLKLGF